MKAVEAMADFEDSVRKQQAKLDAMRKELWPRFAEFRDGFIEQLVTFANDNFYVGTKRVTMPVIDVKDDGWEDLHITLNFHRLRLVYPARLPADPLPAFEIEIYQDTKGASQLYGGIQASSPPQ